MSVGIPGNQYCTPGLQGGGAWLENFGLEQAGMPLLREPDRSTMDNVLTQLYPPKRTGPLQIR